jgi:hypothetical protein
MILESSIAHNDIDLIISRHNPGVTSPDAAAFQHNAHKLRRFRAGVHSKVPPALFYPKFAPPPQIIETALEVFAHSNCSLAQPA